MKVFDFGIIREIVKLEDGSDGLLVWYNFGGVIFGDFYFWYFIEEGLLKVWQMWVNIILVGGLEFSWEDWIVVLQLCVVQQYNGSLFLVFIQNFLFFEFSVDDNLLQLFWQNQQLVQKMFCVVNYGIYLVSRLLIFFFMNCFSWLMYDLEKLNLILVVLQIL